MEYSTVHRRCSINASDGLAEPVRASFTKDALTELKVNTEVTSSSALKARQVASIRQQGGGVWGKLPKGAATTQRINCVPTLCANNIPKEVPHLYPRQGPQKGQNPAGQS